jgi:hypothetical protein
MGGSPRNEGALVNYRTIKKAFFHPDKRMVHRTEDNRRGRVEVTFEDGSTESFLGIDRGEFFRWAASNFRGDLAPDGVFHRE